MRWHLGQSFHAALQTPWHALAMGSGGAALVVAIAWLVSGGPLDSVWLHQLWLIPFLGLCCAGMSARLNPSRWRRWLSRFVLTVFVIFGILGIATLGPLIADGKHPVMISVMLAGFVACLYHAVLGIVACAVSSGAYLFRAWHRLTSSQRVM